MKMSVAVTMAVFGLVVMSVRALPQRRQSDTDLAAVDENTLQGGSSSGGPVGPVIPKCPKYNPKTGDLAADDLLSGGNKPVVQPKLTCYTNDVTPNGYEIAWENSDGSGSHEVCTLVVSKPFTDCRGANCGDPGSAGPQEGPASPISGSTDILDARDGDFLEGGVPAKDLVCDIKGFYTYCTPEGILFTVTYTSDQTNGYVVKSITQVSNDKRCPKQPNYPGSSASL